MKNIIRWIVFIPFALICAFIIDFPIHWIIVILGLQADIEYVVYSFVNPFIVIIVATYIAPSHKSKTALTICFAFILFLAYMFIFSSTHKNNPSLDPYFVEKLVLHVAAILSALSFVKLKLNINFPNNMEKALGYSLQLMAIPFFILAFIHWLGSGDPGIHRYSLFSAETWRFNINIIKVMLIAAPGLIFWYLGKEVKSKKI